jgi:hypothetical protein
MNDPAQTMRCNNHHTPPNKSPVPLAAKTGVVAQRPLQIHTIVLQQLR